MLKDVAPGKYRARACEGVWAHIGEKKTPAVGIRFEFSPGEGLPVESIWWIGYLTSTVCSDGVTVAQHTFENLARIGYREDMPLEKDDQGNQKFGKSHVADKELEIVIELKPGLKDATKMFHTVRWINDLGGSRMAGVSVEQVLGGMSLKAEMAAARARMGAPTPKATATAKSPMIDTELPFSEDVPF